ncbi:imidazole glycerol phosphate synthase subunit HisH [Barnesiella viscericola]|uniref:imidazole glycerol phosphate synthase subunit HisH n=1 Tax=Barnesiella viscericola TaxID=397865 RepID=UPI00235223A2|nr:imidazole glycerol phosphate synthase subunit HisH [Barnesiella viscericola]
MEVAVIKYNAGNIYSVLCALRRLGIDPVVSDSPEVLSRADKVIFPGVGEASSAMRYLREHGLDRVIVNLTQPVLAICIGLQLLCLHSEEGDADCLGVFNIPVRRFVPSDGEEKIPHMGWNTLHNLQGPLFRGIGEGSYVYFVHSYYAPVSADCVAQCDYITPFSAALNRDNFYATQFHVEKSGAVGARILENFLTL